MSRKTLSKFGLNSVEGGVVVLRLVADMVRAAKPGDLGARPQSVDASSESDSSLAPQATPIVCLNCGSRHRLPQVNGGTDMTRGAAACRRLAPISFLLRAASFMIA